MTSWYLRRTYEASVNAELWLIKTEFQALPCPRCGKPLVGRLSHDWKSRKPPQTDEVEYHYDLGRDEQAVENLALSYVSSARKQGVFPADPDIFVVETDSLPQEQRGAWPNLGQEEIHRYGRVIGHKVDEVRA